MLRTLANGVYMFGFIAMTPQLYINYRLKSAGAPSVEGVMYKASTRSSTKGEGFAIAMPTIHRLASLRDDLVFFVDSTRGGSTPSIRSASTSSTLHTEDDEPLGKASDVGSSRGGDAHA